MGERTLCIDIGGTGIKGTVYDANGTPTSERVRIPTPRPALPEAVAATAVEVAKQSGEFDRISCGFPGVVLDGVIRTAPNLDGDWEGFPLAAELARRTGRPVRALNDAAIQGLAVIEGKGVELVLTLGTGLGSGIYVDGHCIPLELGHHPAGLGKRPTATYEDLVDDAQRKKIGKKKWRARVLAIIEQLQPIFNFRRLYIGGGNSSKLDPAELPPWVTLVDNKAGMLGGLKLWAD
jgi:polyphosphate glucokinase